MGDDILIRVWNDVTDFDRKLQSIASEAITKCKIEDGLHKKKIFTPEIGLMEWAVVVISIVYWIVATCANMHNYNASFLDCLISGLIAYGFNLNAMKFCWITFLIGKRFAKLGDLLSESMSKNNNQLTCDLKSHVSKNTIIFVVIHGNNKYMAPMPVLTNTLPQEIE
ncbi:hypothetical protein QAD02_017812 [Eretmocerus hayati]|uniref:Uncharacterized protein n=1 Tax=Eretmocerus hayati TaxID=131215 RepID=A0ACC2PJR4_9HYME|nr:hypothetical protein QAD02_017812 [Eretmocerus hayati]